MILTKQQFLSLEIGLDTDDEEFIEEDGFDWFPIFTTERKSHLYIPQFFRLKDEAYGDTRSKFRITLNNKKQYISTKELSSLEIGANLTLTENSDYKCSDEKGITWIPLFVKTLESLVYNPFLPDLNLKDYKFRIDIKK